MRRASAGLAAPPSGIYWRSGLRQELGIDGGPPAGTERALPGASMHPNSCATVRFSFCVFNGPTDKMIERVAVRRRGMSGETIVCIDTFGPQCFWHRHTTARTVSPVNIARLPGRCTAVRTETKGHDHLIRGGIVLECECCK